jgi:hypothetical protein
MAGSTFPVDISLRGTGGSPGCFRPQGGRASQAGSVKAWRAYPDAGPLITRPAAVCRRVASSPRGVEAGTLLSEEARVWVSSGCCIFF